jgi:hypothetical protein
MNKDWIKNNTERFTIEELDELDKYRRYKGYSAIFGFFVFMFPQYTIVSKLKTQKSIYSISLHLLPLLGCYIASRPISYKQNVFVNSLYEKYKES